MNVRSKNAERCADHTCDTTTGYDGHISFDPLNHLQVMATGQSRKTQDFTFK